MRSRAITRATSLLLLMALVLAGCGGGNSSGTLPRFPGPISASGISPTSALAQAAGGPATLAKILALRPGQQLLVAAGASWQSPSAGNSNRHTQCGGLNISSAALRVPQCSSGPAGTTVWTAIGAYRVSGTWNGSAATAVSAVAYSATTGAQDASEVSPVTTIGTTEAVTSWQVDVAGVTPQAVGVQPIDTATLLPGVNTLPGGATLNLDTTNYVATVDETVNGVAIHAVGTIDPDGTDIDVAVSTSTGQQFTVVAPVSIFQTTDGGAPSLVMRGDGINTNEIVAYDPSMLTDVGLSSPLQIAGNASVSWWAGAVASVTGAVAGAAAALATFVPETAPIAGPTAAAAAAISGVAAAVAYFTQPSAPPPAPSSTPSTTTKTGS